MSFPDRLRLPLDFDPVRLARDLAQATAWRRHFVRQNYEGDWDVIALRAPSDARHPSSMINARPISGASFADTKLLEACPYFREVLASFRCPLDSARLMRLSAGSTIKEHFDDGMSFEEGRTRLHIPIQTNPQVDFRINGTRVEMAPGTTWYLRLSDPHGVTNRGESDRVHLVVDAVADDWLGRMFAAATNLRGGDLFLATPPG